MSTVRLGTAGAIARLQDNPANLAGRLSVLLSASLVFGGPMAVALRAELEPCQIHLVGDFDDGYRRFLRSAILAALDRGHRQVVVDCDAWKRLDLGVLSALIHGAKACAIRGATFELVNLAKELRSDIDALRLTGRLGLYS